MTRRGSMQVRVGDGTGTAKAMINDGWAHLVYPSGARRVMHPRNIAPEGEPTPAERELMAALVDAGDSGILYPLTHLRVAMHALIRAGYAAEDERRRLVLTEKGWAVAGR